MAISTDERNQTHCPNCYALKSPWQGLAFTCSACGQSFATTQPERPPESPLVERLRDVVSRMDSRDWYAATVLMSEAATAISLSQTEIKGHMRIEDDLKAELAEVKADLVDEAPARFQLQAALERAQTKWQEAQIRIAELEKALRDLLAANPRYDASAELDAAIDAALKSRA